MTSVDDGIVSMKFDNESFQRKLTDTIASLDKLRASLDMAGSTRGMSEVAAASRAIDFTPMGSAIDSISTKFLALSTVAISVLSNITMQVFRSAQQMSSAFTVAPIMQGFQEYETNMNSIQTILSNTRADGTNLEQVNAALNQLNAYSDQTIYNFAQMARNIGTFTAAGVDLDTSVGAIKGIANLAAVSGSNAEQASSAMYQLSQALATGTVKLIDWNSVVNAGMGGEVFQKALFATGQAMGTLTSTHVGQTFEEWTAAGNNFRESLQDGWITTKVLSTTLQGFTGDMTEAQLAAEGYSSAQITEIMALGADARAAATEVKTFTQLLGTVKESIGSGWSATFRLIIGDFEQAKTLFTEINNAIGGMVGRSATARNSMLQAWGDFGARNALIEGFRNAFEALGNVIEPIRVAFRELFPRTTAADLIILTDRFRDFTGRIRDLTENYIPRLTFIFRGFFSAIDIVKEVLSGVAGVIRTAFGELTEGSSGPVLRFFTDIARAVVNLHELLVTDGAIQRFFYDITRLIENPEHGLQRLQNRFESLFGNGVGIPGAEGATNLLGRIGDRLSMLGDISDRVSDAWGRFTDRMSGVTTVLSDIWDAISTFFSEMGDRLTEAFSTGDFDGAVDIINVGLLGGILLAIRHFMESWRTLDFGQGFISHITGALEGVTDTLSAMQAQLRSRTLMNIAIAMAVLAGSITVLSLIDSDKLTIALTAMAVGFGQLMGAMAIMNMSSFTQITGSRMAAMATTMILLAAAVGILSIAVTNFSQLSVSELARGLGGVAVGLGLLSAATRLISADTDGLIRAGIAMGVMAVSMRLLAWAVRAFSEMSWEEMAQGLVGVGVGMGILVAAMNLMPTEELAVSATGILIISGAMWVLAQAVEAFSSMSWADMGQGLLGVAGGLAAIVLAMRLMPTAELAVSATGILIISGAMWVLAQAIQELGQMGLGDMVQGLIGMAAALVIIAAAMASMEGAAPGAAAMVVVSGALWILTDVLERLGQLSIAQLVTGLAALAAVFVIIGGASILLAGTIPTMLGLGIALGAIGIAFALFGAGAFLVAKAFEAIAGAGMAGVQVLIAILDELARALPGFIASLIEGFIQGIADLIDAFPVLVDAIGQLIFQVVETFTELVPEFAALGRTIIHEFLTSVRQLFPEIVETGYQFILTLLHGASDNIGEIANVGTDLIVNLLTALANNLPELVAMGAMFIITFLGELANHAEDIALAGLELLVSFIQGISEGIDLITNAVVALITTFITSIDEGAQTIINAGFRLLMNLLNGIANNIVNVANTVFNIITMFINTLDEGAQQLIDAGFRLLTNLVSGVINNIIEITNTVGTLVTEFVTAMGNNAYQFVTAGGDALAKFFDGIAEQIPNVAKSATNVVIAFITALGSNAIRIINAAADVIVNFVEGLAKAIDTHSEELRTAGRHLAGAIIDGMTLGLAGRAADVARSAAGVSTGAIRAAEEALDSHSPSREFIRIGESMPAGLVVALSRDTTAAASAASLAKRTIGAFNSVLSRIPFELAHIQDFNPVITPVLDLTKVAEEAQKLTQYMSGGEISPEVSLQNARIVSAGIFDRNSEDATPPPEAPTSVTFEQNNYSPESLSTNDIYRNTKNQIALAKEELGIS